MKNRTLHAGIKRSPYEALFRGPARIRLQSANLSIGVYSKLVNEEDLENTLASYSSVTTIAAEETSGITGIKTTGSDDVIYFADLNTEANVSCANYSKKCSDSTICEVCARPLSKS